MKKVTTLYLDVEAYEELKKVCCRLNVPVSAKMDELVKRAVAELTGKEFEDAVKELDYEALKKEYWKVVAELDRLQKYVVDQKVYEDMKAVMVKVGVDTKDYTNVKEVSGEFLRQWKGSKEHAHFCVSLLECVQRKHEIEHQLEEIRMKGV